MGFQGLESCSMDLANTLRTAYKTSDFIAWQQNAALDLQPRFQRRQVWKPGAKSYFLDSVIRGFPIPSLIFRDKPTNLSSLISAREVVDGQQRLRTLLAFISPTLLKDYDASKDDFTIAKAHYPELAGMRFNDLPPDKRQRILDYQFTVHIFPAATDDRDVLEVFARMNATGVKLNKQELRNAAFYGFFKVTAFRLATEQLQRWLKTGVFGDRDIGRMAEVEFTSELIILMMNGISEGSAKLIDKHYKDYDQKFDAQETVEERFHAVMDQLGHFDYAQMPRMSNRTLFYCLYAAVHGLMFGATGLAKKKHRSLANDEIKAITQAGKRLSEGTAPQAIQQLTERRMTHAKERKQVTEYLTKSL